jgi:hypothetical protein
MTIHDPDLRPAKVSPVASDPALAGGVLSIDLVAIEANWKKLASTTVPVECAAVVKADAYGCGIEGPAAGPSSSPMSPKDAACGQSRPMPPSTC